MRIIPAIDILHGKCVRLTKGNYSTQKIYNENPLEIAKVFEDNGLSYLHLVDLDGAKSNQIVNYKVLENIAANTNLQINFGGGVKSNSEITLAFNCGASQVTIGSVAVHYPDIFLQWLTKYGKHKIILGADAINRKVSTQGWLENSSLDIVDFISNYSQKGVEYVICTDIEKDGMLQGTSQEMYSEILSNHKIKLIASGGVSSIDDLKNLHAIGCEGAIIGKAIYENLIPIKSLSTIC